MGNQIVVVDPQTGQTRTARPTTFAELGVTERYDLEEWIKENTDILGTELLVLTSEYDKFDKSDKRLDLLALDKEGKIVVVELKRDAAHTLADLQAIRYAAFCSTLTFEAAVEMRSRFAKVDTETAKREIRDFVEDTSFSTLDAKPRIILAAGGFDDQQLTASVCWLRTFGLDISCVEVTPYTLWESGRFILVPRVIIPPPQIEQYMVRVAKKEAEQGSDELSPTKALQAQFWTEFVRYCESNQAPPQLISNPRAVAWYQIGLGFAGCFIELKALSQPVGFACQLVVEGSDSFTIYKNLENQKADIENALESTLEWIRPPHDRKRGRIVQTRPGNFESRENREENFAWLRNRAEAFYNVFMPRLNSIINGPSSSE